MRKRPDQEKRLAKMLAPCAQSPGLSRGRAVDERIEDHLSAYQRDVDRLVHCRWHRRLDGKSHSFLTDGGDVIRTHLTFAGEAESTARNLCVLLGFNGNLAAAIVRLRAIGRPPFGAAGQEVLHRTMRDHGGFSAPAQSVRIACDLALTYPEFNGLNLCWETLEGVAHPFYGGTTLPWKTAAKLPRPGLECQVADLAERVASLTLGIDDGLEFGYLSEDDLTELELWQNVRGEALKTYTRLEPRRAALWCLHSLGDHLLALAAEASEKRLAEAKIDVPDLARAHTEVLVDFDASLTPQIHAMETLLAERLSTPPRLAEINQRACQCLEQLLDCLTAHPHLVPETYKIRAKKEGMRRVACDFISSMTDRMALNEHQRVIGGDRAFMTTGLEQPALF